MRVLVLRCLDWDPQESFEPVVQAAETVAAGVEVLRPGLLAAAAAPAAAYWGSEEAAAEAFVDAAADCDVEALVGLADGLFAARLASRRGAAVPPGGAARFLHDWDVDFLDAPELAAALRRLGVRTLGQFARLPAAAVAERFGALGTRLRRQAGGEDPRGPTRRTPSTSVEVEARFEPGVERVDQAAFAARGLAARLRGRLEERQLACARLLVEAGFVEGEERSRIWRAPTALTESGLAERVRWQLQGWLDAGEELGALGRLRLEALEPFPAVQAQPGLWGGGDGEGRDRLERVVVRLQGLLGPEGAVRARPVGGRGLVERSRWEPWGEASPVSPARPWPGALPPPSPNLLPRLPTPAELFDAAGRTLAVDGRGRLSGSPQRARIGGADHRVTAWAGPWPLAEGWWRPRPRRRARLQLQLEDGRALVLSLEDGKWAVEGWYD